MGFLQWIASKFYNAIKKGMKLVFALKLKVIYVWCQFVLPIAKSMHYFGGEALWFQQGLMMQFGVWRFLIWRFSNKVTFGDAIWFAWSITIWRLSSKVSFVICRVSLHFGGFLARSSEGGRVCVQWLCASLWFARVPTRSTIWFHYLLRLSNKVQWCVCVFVYVQFCWFHSIFVLLSCYVFWNLCVQWLCCNVKLIFVHCIIVTCDLEARECVQCLNFKVSCLYV